MPMKTIDDLCRICVQESLTYKHIYDQYVLDIRLFEIINDLCQLNVYVGDGLPKYICCGCHDKLLEFHKFKQTSHEGKAALTSIKMKLEKMNAEARVIGGVETGSSGESSETQFEGDGWSNRQLPVESIGQLLEVHIKEEPEDMTIEGPEDYSAIIKRESRMHEFEQVCDPSYGESASTAVADEQDTYHSDCAKSAVVESKFPDHSNSGVKPRKKCRKCFVPYCKNTTSANADRGFVNVPLHRDRRIEWFKAARRDLSRMPSYELYCCGDHFNLPEDTENYMYHQTMGVRLRIKKDVLPHIFHCQPNRGDSNVVPSSKIPASYDRGHLIHGDVLPSSSAHVK